ASEALNQTWRTVLAEAAQPEGFYQRRIPLTCCWPAHGAIHRPAEARLLILETETKSLRGLRLRDETKGYSIDVAPDTAGRADRSLIRIHETNPLYREIFIIF